MATREEKKGRTCFKKVDDRRWRSSGKWTGIPDRREWFRFHRQGSHVTGREQMNRYFAELNFYLI